MYLCQFLLNLHSTYACFSLIALHLVETVCRVHFRCVVHSSCLIDNSFLRQNTLQMVPPADNKFYCNLAEHNRLHCVFVWILNAELHSSPVEFGCVCNQFQSTR